jgi:hypothetical protein
MEGKINETQRVNAIIKHRGFKTVKIVVVTIGSISAEIEITTENPGDVVARLMCTKAIEKDSLRGMVARSIDVGYADRGRVRSKREVYQENVIHRKRVCEREEVLIPCHENPARSPNSVDRTEGMEVGRQERGRLGGRGRREFSFLQGNDLRPSDENVSIG